VNFPLLGTMVQEPFHSDKLRDLMLRPYVVRYLVMKQEIHILRIWHGKEERLLIEDK